MGLNTAASLSFSQINSALFFTNGNLGVNTTAPAFNIDVNGTINASGKSTLQNVSATNISATNFITTSVTSGLLAATNIIGTNISAGILSATTITGANLSLSGNMTIGGTVTTIRITSSNIIDTNVSIGILNVTGTSTLANVVMTNLSCGALISSTGFTTGTINATGISNLANVTATNISASTLIATTNITTAALSATNISVGGVIANTNIISGAIRSTILGLNGNNKVLSSTTASTSNGIYSTFANGNSKNGLIGIDGLGYGNYDVGAFMISTFTNSPLNFVTNQTLRATITTNGNFGIGIATPAYTLDVSGSINASTSITTAALSATNISAGRIIGTGISTGSLYTDGITVGNILRLNDNPVYLRGGSDLNHGIGWNSTMDGPCLWGFLGGNLNTVNNASSLSWNATSVGIGMSNPGAANTNTVSINTTTNVPAINPDAYNTLLVHEDMQGTSLRYGTLGGSATYIQNTGGTTGYVQLSPDTGGSGDWSLGNMNLGNAFTVDYEIQVPGAADYHNFYWGNYFVSFNEWNDAIYLGYAGVTLTSAYKPQGNDTNWYKIRIVFQRNTIKIYHNGTLAINYKDTARHENYSNANYTYFNCWTGGETSAHRIRDLRIQRLLEGAWSSTTQTSGSIMFNGGNVGINTTSAAYTLDVNSDVMIRGNLYSTSVPNSTSAIPLIKASASFIWTGSSVIVGQDGASGSGKNNTYNIASITRSAVGVYNVVFTNAMSNSNYTISTSFERLGINWQFVSTHNLSTTGFTMQFYSQITVGAAGVLADATNKKLFFAVL